ncbi:MAG: cytochrome c biogenesis protein ResB, partial [Deferribacterales bacterium]
SYGFFPSKDVKFIFNFKSKEMEKKIVVGMDEGYKIDDKISFAVRDFAPSLSLDSQGKLINLNDMMINPAVIVEFMMEGEHNISVPILANYPQTGEFDLFDLQFVKAYGVQFSVLSVNYNPFIWLIYVGFFVLAVGVVITFMFEHKLVFIKIAEDNGKSYIWVNGYRKRFKKDLNRFLTDLKNKIEKIVGNKDE